MPRPRIKRNSSLPDHLYFDKTDGTYRFMLINGQRKTLGADRAMAIAIAHEYNRQMRPEIHISVDSLIRASGGMNGEAKPFSEYVDKLLARAKKDERPSEGSWHTWQMDGERIKAFFCDIPACDIELEHVNEFIKHNHGDASANVQNRKVAFLKKLFSYAMDESLMIDNPASRKKMRRVDAKVRRRLSLDDYIKMRRSAEPWLRTAMDLALQTAQARLEVSRIKYNIKTPREGVCGCVWWPEPKDGIYGMLYIHRQKVQHKESAHVAIPIGDELRTIIESSRDSIASPYVVHRLPEKRSNPISKAVRHPTQVDPNYLSRAFSALRDRVGVCAELKPEERPTFHEIRALAAHLFKSQGIDPQERMAHSDAKSTQIYTQNHRQWVEVPHAEIRLA